MSYWFEARYPGRCAGCDNPISLGDTITKAQNGLTYYGECCADEVKEEPEEMEKEDESIPALRAGETICDRCRIVRPCFC